MRTIQYRIPEHLREAIKARDVTCCFPGCHARAEFFHCDHTVAHPIGQNLPTQPRGAVPPA